ncbi:MAG: hypothetical protein ABUL60_16905 [Myxococcales bacterium]
MRKFVGSAVVAIACLSIVGVAHAAMTWSSSVSITKIDVEGDPTGSTAASDTYVKFNATPLSSGCSAASTGTWVVGGSADNIKAMTQLLMSARLAGLNVKILFNDSHSGFESCNGGGTTGYPKIRGVEIQ